MGHLGLGGSERQLYLLLKHLDRNIFECHVVVFNPSPYFVLNDSLQKTGIKVLQVPEACKGIPRRIGFIYETLRKLEPDIVHSWTAHDNPYAGLVGWAARVPVRFGSLRGSVGLPGFQKLTPILRWLSLYSVRKLVVNSQAILEELVRQGYPSDRVTVLPNCVEQCFSSTVTPDLSALEIKNCHSLVGIVGNLRSVKNHMMFVEVMAKVFPNFSNVRGLIVGQPTPKDPGLTDRLQSKVRELRLEGRVMLAGFRPDVAALMHRLSVFCLTSTSEGMPNVILEAMAAARPVVATRVGGVGELVEDGVNGFLVEPNDIEGFADRVTHLLSHPEHAELMGLAGRGRVQREFGCDQAATRLTRLYLEALQQKGLVPEQT
ncbi:MAG: glycosyltransferase [Proteobacteria bacterium]|nr:glycosyltransferase [Pseudomonadota bacterium]